MCGLASPQLDAYQHASDERQAAVDPGELGGSQPAKPGHDLLSDVDRVLRIQADRAQLPVEAAVVAVAVLPHDGNDVAAGVGEVLLVMCMQPKVTAVEDRFPDQQSARQTRDNRRPAPSGFKRSA